MIALFAVQALASATLSPQQAKIVAYQNCLSTIVRANELASEKDYQPLEVVLDRIKVRCSTERAAARDALMALVVASHPDRPRQPTDFEKEQLINDATHRWANNVVVRIAVGEDR